MADRRRAANDCAGEGESVYSQKESDLPADLGVMGGIGVSIHLEIGVKKAIEWISHKRQENPKVSLSILVEEACRKFDLSPLQADFLYRHFVQTQ